MANAGLSPAAILLRNSRLFSLPPPLPRPAALTSETATQPYPTHAAIETPPSSWARGDWGFKRSLPLKSTKRTGTTTIRVQNGIDSPQHITDFESAADHVLTLRKWQELNLPIQTGSSIKQRGRGSVFGSEVDNIKANATNHRRWRYDGPWLAGQTGMEFDALLKKIKNRRAEFRDFLRARLNADRNRQRRHEAMEEGEKMGSEELEPVTDKEFEQHIRYLRATPSAFGPFIAEFLDLPEGPSELNAPGLEEKRFSYGRSTVADDAYKESGPPLTHPSAGVSYLRSGAHLSNHPIYGPQLLPPPLTGRVLRPSNARRRNADIGVAGVVISSGITALSLDNTLKRPWEPGSGSGKVITRPKAASVDSRGKFRFLVENSGTILHSNRAKPATPPKSQTFSPAMSTKWKQMPNLDAGGGMTGAQPVRPGGEHRQELDYLLSRNPEHI